MKRQRFLIKNCAVAFCVLVAAAPLYSQIDRATLRGTITDPSGASVPGAKVVATAVRTGTRHETVTATDGTYHLPALPVGIYKVEFSAKGFKTEVFPHVELLVGQSAAIDGKLEVGAAMQTVQVTGEAPLLDRVSPSVSGVVGGSHIEDLPTNGRNWASNLARVEGASA